MPIFPISPIASVGAPAPGKFHMWWRESDNAQFSKSATRQYIARMFEAAAGIETAFWNALFSPRLLPPSSEGMTVKISPTDASDFVVTFSSEKGVRLHFDPATTSPEARDAAWLEFATFAEKLRAQLSMSVWFRLRQPFRSNGAHAWWRNTEQVVATLEAAGDPPQAVGTVMVGAA